MGPTTQGKQDGGKHHYNHHQSWSSPFVKCCWLERGLHDEEPNLSLGVYSNSIFLFPLPLDKELVQFLVFTAASPWIERTVLSSCLPLRTKNQGHQESIHLLCEQFLIFNKNGPNHVSLVIQHKHSKFTPSKL